MLSPIDRNYGVGADECARHAADAVLGLYLLREMESAFVEAAAELERVRGAGGNAESAALATVGVDVDVSGLYGISHDA